MARTVDLRRRSLKESRLLWWRAIGKVPIRLYRALVCTVGEPLPVIKSGHWPGHLGWQLYIFGGQVGGRLWMVCGSDTGGRSQALLRSDHSRSRYTLLQEHWNLSIHATQGNPVWVPSPRRSRAGMNISFPVFEHFAVARVMFVVNSNDISLSLRIVTSSWKWFLCFASQSDWILQVYYFGSSVQIKTRRTFLLAKTTNCSTKWADRHINQTLPQAKTSAPTIALA